MFLPDWCFEGWRYKMDDGMGSGSRQRAGQTRVQLSKPWMGGFKRAYLKLEPVALGNIHVYIELR